MFTNQIERRNRRAFASAQAAWDNATDPVWGEPDPEPEDEPEEDNEE